MDSLCNRILEVKDGEIRLFVGNYTAYKEQSELEFETAELEYNKYITEKARLEDAIKERAGKAKSIRKAPKRMGNSEARLHRRSANEIQEKINNAGNILKTRLEKLEAKEKPRELPRIKLDFALTNPPENKIIISVEGLSFSYGSKKILDNVKFKVLNKTKTAIWGENGAGKTTLLNLLCGHGMEEGKGIYIVPKATIGYFCQGLENLDEHKTVLENVMMDSVQNQTAARTILARLLIAGDSVYKKVRVLSGGERIKVSFAKLLVSKANVLLLDEPTNYLDMMSVEALENVLSDYEGTVLFVSHDKAFVIAIADRLLILENKTVTEFEGGLDDYLKPKKQNSEDNQMERMLLQMRITELVTKLSNPGADKAVLEAEYQRLLLKIKKADN